MLSAFFAALKAEFSGNSKDILWNVYAIVHLLEDQYIKDGNAKDAAIDALCIFLQQHKTTSQTNQSNQLKGVQDAQKTP